MENIVFINVVVRIKEIIIRGGEKFYPREIEEMLLSHPSIREAQVNMIS